MNEAWVGEAVERIPGMLLSHTTDAIRIELLAAEKRGMLLALEAAEERVRKLAGRNLGNDEMFGHAARAIRSLLEEVRNA